MEEVSLLELFSFSVKWKSLSQHSANEPSSRHQSYHGQLPHHWRSFMK